MRQRFSNFFDWWKPLGHFQPKPSPISLDIIVYVVIIITVYYNIMFPKQVGTPLRRHYICCQNILRVLCPQALRGPANGTERGGIGTSYFTYDNIVRLTIAMKCRVQRKLAGTVLPFRELWNTPAIPDFPRDNGGWEELESVCGLGIRHECMLVF